MVNTLLQAFPNPATTGRIAFATARLRAKPLTDNRTRFPAQSLEQRELGAESSLARHGLRSNRDARQLSQRLKKPVSRREWRGTGLEPAQIEDEN